MSTMSCLRRKLTVHKEVRVRTARGRVAIRLEQRKLEYTKLPKEEKRSRIAAIIHRLGFQ